MSSERSPGVVPKAGRIVASPCAVFVTDLRDLRHPRIITAVPITRRVIDSRYAHWSNHVTRQDVLNLVSRGSSPHVLAVTTVEMTVRSAHSWYASLVWLKGNVFPTVAFMLICPVSISLTWRGESRRSLVPPPVPGQWCFGPSAHCDAGSETNALLG